MNTAPLPLDHKGKTYYVHSLTDEMRNAFAAWMKAEAIKSTLAMRQFYPAADFRLILNELNSDIAISKKFEFGGAKFQEMVQSEAGACEWIRIVLMDPSLPDSYIQTLILDVGDKYNELFKIANPAGEDDGDPDPKA